MRINNPYFGMSLDSGIDDDNANNAIYEPAENRDFEMVNVKKADMIDADGAYELWHSENIEEYISLMAKCFDNPDLEISRPMLRVISDDKRFAQKYKYYITSLLERIDEGEVKTFKKTDEGQEIFINWNSDLEVFCRDHKNDYNERSRFLSLYGGIKDKINCISKA